MLPPLIAQGGEEMEFWVALAASGLAGFLDAMVGGGGLVLVPALFALYPQAAPPTLFGTNKGAAVWGTSWAAWRFARRVDLDWRNMAWAAACTGAAAAAGAWLVTWVDARALRVALPWLLAAMLLYTLWRRHLGRDHAPRFSGAAERLRACALGAAIGFYDGCFGPGTGSLLVFGFVRWLGYDFLHASAAAKWLNAASNVAAVALFASKGHVWWHLALPMAAANVAGSLLGTGLALARGAAFVRGVFVLVVAALIAKTAWDVW